MKITVENNKGNKTRRSVELLDSIFAAEVNENLLYEDVRRYMNNKRQGSSSTKERGQVRGGGRKAYRQKGTGMARRGSIRSPLLKGGGTVHGPQPRSYKHGLPKKMRRAARKSALTLKQAENNIHIIEDLEFKAPKTKEIINLLNVFELQGSKVLLLTAGDKSNVYLSARNIQNVKVIEADKVYTYAILDADVLLIEEGALENLQQSIQPKEEEAAA